jgi:hypothetical protein
MISDSDLISLFQEMVRCCFVGLTLRFASLSTDFLAWAWIRYIRQVIRFIVLETWFCIASVMLPKAAIQVWFHLKTVSKQSCWPRAASVRNQVHRWFRIQPCQRQNTLYNGMFLFLCLLACLLVCLLACVYMSVGWGRTCFLVGLFASMYHCIIQSM